MKSLPALIAMVLLSAYSTPAQTPTPSPKSTPSPTPAQAISKRSSLKYKAPKNGAIGTRDDIDAGTRGWTPKLPSIYVLAPNHTGLTTRAQPSLFWYQSGPSSVPIEITLIQSGKPGWLLRVGADTANETGIHRLSLERHHITLTPGILYRWTVALVPNRANRSESLIASDTIQRIEPDADLSADLKARKGLDLAGAYAKSGIWYDALEAVTNEIDEAPKNQELRLLRATLLGQAGLGAPEASERR